MPSTSSAPIQIAFARFWEGFDPEDNWFTQLLRRRFDVRVSDTPEVVIYSVYGGELPPGSYVKVFYSPENVAPDLEECDWSFAFEYDDHLTDPRHLRMPNYVTCCEPEDLVKAPDAAAHVEERPRFCGYVYKNRVRFRRRFFRRLSRHGRIASPGKDMNNMPALGGHRDPKESRKSKNRSSEKLDFLRECKFSIAFENTSQAGYQTEKLPEAMLGGTIPIYWGNPLVHRDFNPRSFINYHDHEEPIRRRIPAFLRAMPVLGPLLERWVVEPLASRGVIRRVLEIHRDPDLYRRYLEEPWYHDNRPTEVMSRERVLDRFEEIFRGVREAANAAGTGG